MNSKEQIKENFKEIIANVGHAVLGVFGDEKSGIPQFSYTIGLSLCGLPELIIPCVNPQTARKILNAIVADMDDGKKFEAGTTQNEIFKNLPCHLLAVDADEVADTMKWIEFVTEKPGASAIHLTVPDANGRMPWESGCGDPGLEQFRIYKNEILMPTMAQKSGYN